MSSSLSTADRRRLRAAVHGTMVAEFAAVRDGKPVAYPLTPLYDDRRSTLVVTSPPAFARKVDAVRSHPSVSVLLPGEDPLLVTGEATVRDADLSGNGWYMQGLALEEPDSPKVDLYREAEALLRTRPGRALLDWYGLRIVLEIDPVAVVARPGDPTASVSAWDAVGLTPREAREYRRAVATVVDDDGYPVSWTVPSVDPSNDPSADDGVRLSPPPGVPASEGRPASLLLHWYGPGVRTFGQRTVRGRLRTAGDGVWFDPASSSVHRKATRLDAIRMVVSGKRRTRRYFGETSPFVWTWPLEDGVPCLRPPWASDEPTGE